MRLWSIDLSYLDSKGLVALWREALLARAVLNGATKGYTNHPQLIRFRETPDPIAAIELYLYYILEEALQRGYKFDQSKVTQCKEVIDIKVTVGQLDYELKHLKKKLKDRSMESYNKLRGVRRAKPNKLFKETEGPVANWEVTKSS